jgi:hypothetical protein
MTRFLLLSDSFEFVEWWTLSDEMTGLSFTIAAGLLQLETIITVD